MAWYDFDWFDDWGDWIKKNVDFDVYASTDVEYGGGTIHPQGGVSNYVDSQDHYDWASYSQWTDSQGHIVQTGTLDTGLTFDLLATGSGTWITYELHDSRADANPWTTTVTHYDAAGLRTSRDLVYDNGDTGMVLFTNGIATTRTDFDTGLNDQPWTTAVFALDAAGVDTSTIHYDDGSTKVTDFDLTGLYAWASHAVITDGVGHTDSETITWDDGGRVVTNYDQDGSALWATMVTAYDALGRKDTLLISNDDGTRAFTDFDEADASAVASVVDRFDALGRKSSETTTWDDATRLVVDYDQDGTKIWSEARTLYDALDRKDEQTIAYDTGKTVATDYDEASVHAWATLALTTDALGREDLAVQVNDDGSKVTRDLDQADTAAWAEKITTTDALSRVTETYVKKDDQTATRTVNDTAAATPFDHFVNSYVASGALSEQTAHGRDDLTTHTTWDTTGAALWQMRQTVTAADGLLVTDTTLYRDGTEQVTFGGAAIGQYVLTAAAGGLALVETTALGASEAALWTSASGTMLRTLGSGMALVTGLASAIYVALRSDAAGGDSYQNLSADVRLHIVDNGQPPGIEMRTVDGAWVGLAGVSATVADGALRIDAAQLRAAIGETRFNALGDTSSLGVTITTAQPTPIATADIPARSIFADGAAAGQVYAIPGTVIDWSRYGDQSSSDQVTVLELRGIEWLNPSAGSLAVPNVGDLSIARTSVTCPSWASVHGTAVDVDNSLRTTNPGLSPTALGQLIHQQIAEDIALWGPQYGLAVEQGILGGVVLPPGTVILPPGSSRLDVLERTPANAVCIYDIKTGGTIMRQSDMMRYASEASQYAAQRGFVPTAIYVIPVYTRSY